MTAERPESLDAMLLDLHLNQLEPKQAAQMRQDMAAAAELNTRSRSLARVLSLLDQDPIPEPPPDLADLVLERIEQHTGQTLRMPTMPPPSDADRGFSAGTFLVSLREVLAVAACIVLFIGIFVPGYYKAQSSARRNACLGNLRQIGSAVNMYTEANLGFLPHAHYVQNASWLPTPTPGVQRVSNTQPFFQLVRRGYIQGRDVRIFVCPASRNGLPMIADNYRLFTDFAEPANVSYSFFFTNTPHGVQANNLTTTGYRSMVLVADRNPLTDPADQRINPLDEHHSNSRTHDDGAGQNAVFVSGNGGWFTEPTIGVENDNIYRAGQRTRYQGTEQPTCLTDTLLIP